MTRAKYYKPLLVALALSFLAGTGFLQRHLNQARVQMGLTRLDPLANAPPILAFTTVALGGFRGLIANALWVRAVEMQDEGKYFEMVQLADWITKLQPHIAAVWVNQAWNMAYNISVKFQDAQDRWHWVLRGIQLLRDEGLRYNPQDILIYRELAWFFQHKMGQNLDDAHKYYKQVWAQEMTKVLGGGRPNFPELLHPATPEVNQRVNEMREKYKLDPLLMQSVDEQYGPLDWRLPETHAIYWAWVGLLNVETNCPPALRQAVEKLFGVRESPIIPKKDDLITLRRVIYQSMQLAFQRGRLVASKYGDRFDLEPNLDMIPNANRAYEDMMQQDPPNRDHIQTGHRNFLKDAVYFLYSYNRLTEANHWYQYLGKKYPDVPLIPARPDSLPTRLSMVDYALDRLQEDAGETSDVRVTALIEGLIGNAYLNLALGFEDRFASFERKAEAIYARYQKKIAGAEVRVALAPLKQIKQEMLTRILGPESSLNDEYKARLRTELRLAPPPSAPATNTPAANPVPPNP